MNKGRAEKAEEKKKPPAICVNPCNLWTSVKSDRMIDEE